MVKTICLCLQRKDFLDIESALSWAYLTPQVLQNLDLHLKGTLRNFPQCSQIYIAYPKSGLPQLITLLTSSKIESLIKILGLSITKLFQLSWKICWIVNWDINFHQKYFIIKIKKLN